MNREKGVLESACANCGTPFVRTRSRQYYCSLQCRQKYNYQKEAAEKHSRVSLSPTEWELYKKDPQREHEQKDNFVVCRECPEKHAALQRHIIAKQDRKSTRLNSSHRC